MKKLLIVFIFFSCAYLTKNSNKECEDIIEANRKIREVNREFRKDCFDLIDDQSRQIDSLITELEKCQKQ